VGDKGHKIEGAWKGRGGGDGGNRGFKSFLGSGGRKEGRVYILLGWKRRERTAESIELKMFIGGGLEGGGD